MQVAPYQQVLRERYAELAPVLQRLHDDSPLRAAEGMFQVERGRGRWARIMAAVMRLPRETPAVAVRLEIEATARGECWRRWFDQQQVITWQAAAGERLRESFFPFSMLFDLQVQAASLQMESRQVRLLGIPLPSFVSPRITASETPLEEGWQVEVEIRLPGIGRVVRYCGAMKPT